MSRNLTSAHSKKWNEEKCKCECSISCPRHMIRDVHHCTCKYLNRQ